MSHDGQKLVFCSEPCEWIFRSDLDRYAKHVDVAHRILAGQAPANVVQLVTEYFDLTPETWGKDAYHGNYPWLAK
jgi:toluene monooxygenase system protein A